MTAAAVPVAADQDSAGQKYTPGLNDPGRPGLTEAELWQLVHENEALLRRETRRHLPKHRRHEFEAMYSDVVTARAHSIHRLYDPARGVRPLTHLVRNCKWYAFEWAMGRKYKKVPVPEDLGDASGRAPLASDAAHRARLELESVLELVPQELRRVLVWRHVKNFGLDEIADHLSIEEGRRVKQSEVQEMLSAAMFLARMVALDEDDHERMYGS